MKGFHDRNIVLALTLSTKLRPIIRENLFFCGHFIKLSFFGRALLCHGTRNLALAKVGMGFISHHGVKHSIPLLSSSISSESGLKPLRQVQSSPFAFLPSSLEPQFTRANTAKSRVIILTVFILVNFGRLPSNVNPLKKLVKK